MCLRLVYLHLNLIGGYGINDCGQNGGASCRTWTICSLAVVMTVYGDSSVSCACGFLLKRLNDDFLEFIV